jgi:hypothetical protein
MSFFIELHTTVQMALFRAIVRERNEGRWMGQRGD